MIAVPKARPFTLGKSASSASASGFAYNMTLFSLKVSVEEK